MSCGKCETDKTKDSKETKTEKAEALGQVTHYYDGLGVGIVELKGMLKTGDKIKIKGHTTELDQAVDSIQIDHKDVSAANSGDVVGIKMVGRVREGDQVYKAE